MDEFMLIETDLLGVVNEDAGNGAALQRKYVLKVTAEQLSQWLHFDRKSKAKSSPFRISEHSVIRIDEDIQRGRDSQGFLLQNSKKIMEIASTLLVPNSEQVPRLYLGCLTWNVRPSSAAKADDMFSVQRIEQPDKPPRWRLSFETDAIYLTDSAHRHLGIVEAYRQYVASKEKFPTFNPKFEFSVELYTLNKTRERELFSELNSKQKKISAAKQKQMDVSSPIGSLKDAIQEYDRTASKFFDNNIEVSSNQNDKHTLLTMSVFVTSISEMFSSKEIKASREDEELQADMASYYCEFFYELEKTLIVAFDQNGEQKEIHPFRNLYTEFIRPALDAYDPEKPQMSEDKHQLAIDEAKAENRRLREQDVANHNSFIKAFARLGGYIRGMENWRDVITRLQTKHVIAHGGKFFQKENKELFEVNSRLGVSIATFNEDGTINVQVQTKTINAVYEYLLDKLSLRRTCSVFHCTVDDDPQRLLVDEPHTHRIPNDGSVYSAFTFNFFLPKSVAVWGENTVRLEIDGGEAWPQVTRKGKAKAIVSNACEPDESYVDEEFADIVQWRASFEIEWPAGATIKRDFAAVSLKFTYPKFENPAEVTSETTILNVART